MPDISLTIDFLRQKYYYINQLKEICLNVLMGVMHYGNKTEIVKVREIKVVVCISITFVSLFLKKGSVVYEKFMWTIFKS